MFSRQVCRVIPATRSAAQRGFLLIELMVVLAITSVLAVYAGKTVINEAQEAVATATGSYMLSVKNALDHYTVDHYNELSNSLPVTGVASPMSPTIAELAALKYLNAGFPSKAPSGQAFAIQITANACPGSTCKLYALAYSTTPYRATPAGSVAYDLATTAWSTAGGYGGFSNLSTPGTIKGPTFSMANPLGNVGGVVAVSSYADAGIYNNFVRIGDTRDPSLQGNLTVAGSIKGATVTSTGTVGAVDSGGCLRAYFQNDGQTITKAADCLAHVWLDPNTGTAIARNPTTGSYASITDAGNAVATNVSGVVDPVDSRAHGYFWNDQQRGNIYLQTKNDTFPAGEILQRANGTSGRATYSDGNSYSYNNGTGWSADWAMGSNGAWKIVTGVDGPSQVAYQAFNDGSGGWSAWTRGSDGTMYAKAAMQSNLFWFQGVGYTQGAACGGMVALGYENGTGNLLLCKAGIWQSAGGLPQATNGAACAQNDALGIDPSGAALMCMSGRWQGLADRIGKYAFVSSQDVLGDTGAGTRIQGPACLNGGVPKVFLYPKTESPALNIYNLYSAPNGDGTFQVYFRTGTGAPIANQVATAGLYCYYN